LRFENANKRVSAVIVFGPIARRVVQLQRT
jgi:hypothetical protein